MSAPRAWLLYSSEGDPVGIALDLPAVQQWHERGGSSKLFDVFEADGLEDREGDDPEEVPF
ncbi:MAG: hypothetical protein AAGM22_32335 [Acidobacteriota bacterium]